MMVGDCRMLGCLHSVFNQVEINGFARRWIMVQQSVLGMRLECQAIIRNCDCELFTRDLHCDPQIWNHMMLTRREKVRRKKLKWGQNSLGRVCWKSLKDVYIVCFALSLSETAAHYVWNSFPLSLSIIPYHSRFFSLSRNFHLDYNSQWLWLFCMLLKLFISFQILSEKRLLSVFIKENLAVFTFPILNWEFIVFKCLVVYLRIGLVCGVRILMIDIE